MPQQDLEVRVVHRHLVHARDAARGCEARRLELELLDPQPVVRGLHPRRRSLVRLRPESARGSSPTPRSIPWAPTGSIASAAAFTTMRCPSARVTTTGRSEIPSSSSPVGTSGIPSGFVEAFDVHDRSARPVSDELEELAFEAAVRTSSFASERPVPVMCTWLSMNPGTIVVPGSSTRSAPGVARADALDVATVDEDPLPQVRMGEGHDARGAVEGPHGAAMIEESRSSSARTCSSSRSARTRDLRSWSSEAHRRRREPERGDRAPHVVTAPPQHDVVHPADVADAGRAECAVDLLEDGVREDRRRLGSDGRPRTPASQTALDVDRGLRRRAQRRGGPPARSIRSSPDVGGANTVPRVAAPSPPAGRHHPRGTDGAATLCGRPRAEGEDLRPERTLDPAGERAHRHAPGLTGRIEPGEPARSAAGLRDRDQACAGSAVPGRRTHRAPVPHRRPSRRGGGARTVPPDGSRAIARRGDIPLPHRRVAPSPRAGRQGPRDPLGAAGRRARDVRGRRRGGRPLRVRGPRAGPQARANRA